MLSLRKWTEPSANAKFAPPGCLLLNPMQYDQLVGSLFIRWLSGMVVTATDWLLLLQEFHLQVSGSASPASRVPLRPSRTADSEITMVPRQKIPRAVST